MSFQQGLEDVTRDVRDGVRSLAKRRHGAARRLSAGAARELDQPGDGAPDRVSGGRHSGAT